MTDIASRSNAWRCRGQSTAAGTDCAQPVFTSADVARIAQISLRQLQWWDERKLISPHQEGHRRIYFVKEVVEIMLVGELRRKGLSLQKIRRILRLLHRQMEEQGQRYAVTGKSTLYLLTDGKSVYLEAAPAPIIDRLKNARQPMWLVCVSDHAQRVASAQHHRRADKQQLRLF